MVLRKSLQWLLFMGMALGVLGLAACSEDRSPANSPLKAHPAEWNEPGSEQFHGTQVAQRTPDSCRSCHGDDLLGDPPAPGCSDCHDGPSGHPEGWGFPNPEPFHGITVAEETYDGCTSCHGSDLRGGWSETSCYLCHDGPSGHPAGWMDQGSRFFHGIRVAEIGFTDCSRCHGDDLRGGWADVSCYSCHDGPSGHPTGWLDSASENFHGTRIRELGPDACRSCHGENLGGGSSGVSCTNACHDGPGGHPQNWMTSGDDDFHGKAVEAAGPNPCRDCHGTELDGGWPEVSCYNACHDGPGGHPSGWLTSVQPNFHGQLVAENTYDDCARCHGAGFDGGTSEVSCYGHCHNGPSGHRNRWMDEGAADFHGRAVEFEGTEDCKACHGDGLDGGWSGVSCYNACHDGPGGHQEGWEEGRFTGSHALFVINNTAESCLPCHGEDGLGGWSGVSCTTCH